MGRGKRTALTALAATVGLLLIVMAAAAYTSRSEFCTSCHYMVPFYESWKKSSHSGVDCTECHFPPGFKSKVRGKLEGLVQFTKYISYAYKKSRPWAEIPDESCLRSGCHETRLLEGKVEFLEGITFDHKPHLQDLRRGKQLRCTSCHSQIVQGKHISVTNSTCFLCHFKDGDKEQAKISRCDLCHNRELMLKLSRENRLSFDHTFAVDKGMECTSCHANTIIGEGPVHRQNCYSCHWEDERLERFGDTDFIHTKHISSRKIECLHCHMEIDHRIGRKEIDVTADCANCHTGQHDAMKKLFSGTGGVDTPDRPSKMLEIGLNCRGCHLFHEKEDGADNAGPSTANFTSCDKCHAEGYGRIISQWDKSTGRKVEELEILSLKARQKVQSSIKDEAMLAEAAKYLDDADYNISIVKKGRSLHNIVYSNNLLASSHRMIKDAAALVGGGWELPPFIIESKDGKPECLTCHFDIKQQVPAYAGVNFSHPNHLERELSCPDCHAEKGRHGALSRDKKGCVSCHHNENVTRDCADCHTLQARIYGGQWEQSTAPNAMSEVVDCAGCHGTGAEIVRPTNASCLECHDKGYEAFMDEWQASTREALAPLPAAIDHLKGGNLTPEARKKLHEIERILKDITDDGSLGVHNPDSVEETLYMLKIELEKLSSGVAAAE